MLKQRKSCWILGISIIDISLDAFTAKSYELVRRGGNRDKTYENVLNPY